MSRIDDNCPHISFNGDALVHYSKQGAYGDKAKRQFEDALSRTLSVLWQESGTGRALLLAIEATAMENGTHLEIVPFTPKEQKDRPKSAAFTSVLFWEKAAPKGVRGFVGKVDDPKTPQDERFERDSFRGTGEGSSVEMHYNPFALGDRVKRFGFLVHELFHALRDMSGLRNPVPTEPALSSYVNHEEYFAMLLENIYRSEAGSDTLVFYDSTEFPEDQKTSVGFLTNTPYGIPNRRLVNKLVNQMTRLCSNVRDLVDLHVKFHPIREFMHHKMKYQVH